MTRTDLRRKALNSIYAVLIQQKAGIDYDPTNILLGEFECEDPAEIDLFTREVFVSALQHQEEITTEVQLFLKKWQFERLNTIAQAIFFEAVAEVKYCQLTDKAVVINCAVNYAKEYLDSKDYKYINAVLDKVL